MYFDTSGAFSLGVKVRFLSLLIFDLAKLFLNGSLA